MFRFTLAVLVSLLMYIQICVPLNDDNLKKDVPIQDSYQCSKYMPGDLVTEPMGVLVFNAPFIDKSTLPISIMNDGEGQIGWAIWTNHEPDMIIFDPERGVLGNKEKTILNITLGDFKRDYLGSIAPAYITIKWALTPNGAPKEFKQEWLCDSHITKQKKMPIIFNV